MKSLWRLRFHILFLTTAITVCHSLSDTQVLAGTVDNWRKTFGLTPKFAIQENTAPSTAALEGIKQILPRLVTNDIIAQELGFSDRNEVDQGKAKIFMPLPNEIDLPYLVFEIYLPNLKNLGIASQEFGEDLLKPTTRLIVPISVDNKIKSSLSLRLFPVNINGLQKQKFEVRRWGSKTLIQALTEARVLHQGGMGTFLVEIPALNRDYLGYLNEKDTDPRSERGLHLITLFQDQHFGAGIDRPATVILKELVEEAKSATVDAGPR